MNKKIEIAKYMNNIINTRNIFLMSIGGLVGLAGTILGFGLTYHSYKSCQEEDKRVDDRSRNVIPSSKFQDLENGKFAILQHDSRSDLISVDHQEIETQVQYQPYTTVGPEFNHNLTTGQTSLDFVARDQIIRKESQHIVFQNFHRFLSDPTFGSTFLNPVQKNIGVNHLYNPSMPVESEIMSGNKLRDLLSKTHDVTLTNIRSDDIYKYNKFRINRTLYFSGHRLNNKFLYKNVHTDPNYLARQEESGLSTLGLLAGVTLTIGSGIYAGSQLLSK